MRKIMQLCLEQSSNIDQQLSIQQMLYSHMQLYAEHDDTIKTTTQSFRKNIPLFIWKVCVWEGVGDWTKTATYWPPFLWPSALCLSRSPDAQPEARGSSSLLDDGFLYRICHQRAWSPNSSGLRTHWGSRRSLCRVVAFPSTSCL